MGCHTWFYSKVDESEVMKLQEYNIEHLRIKAVRLALAELESNPYEDKMDKRIIKRHFNSYRRKLRNLRNGKMKWINILEFVIDNEYPNTLRVIDNELFKDAEGYHDIFRYGNYNGPHLRSLETTLDLISRNSCRASTYMSADGLISPEIDYDKLKEFWTLNPNGLIEFG